MKETPLGSGNPEPEGASPGPAPRVSVRSCTLLGRPRSPLGSMPSIGSSTHRAHSSSLKGSPGLQAEGWAASQVVMPPAPVEWDLSPQRRSHQAGLWGLC